MSDRTGFIGLGAMGGPMAANLLRAGHKLVVHDIRADRARLLADQGAETANSPAEVARRTARTISMVETTDQARSVMLGEDGIAAGAQPAHLVISMSTIDPLALKQLHAALAARDIALIDAPVSGGTVRAKSGDLSILVGGDAHHFEACRPLFAAMGANLFHIGEIGQGLAMKLVNNMLVQVNMVAVTEALALGAKAGLTPQQMIDVVSVSSGNSFAFQQNAARVVSGDFTPGGTIDISYKDQELQTALAKQLGVPLLLANVSQQVYQAGRAAGLGKRDGSALITLYEKMIGVRLGPREDG